MVDWSQAQAFEVIFNKPQIAHMMIARYNKTGTDILSMIANPAWRQMLTQNPAEFQNLMARMKVDNPELYEAILTNQEGFLSLLQKPTQEMPKVTGSNYISIP